MKITGLSSSFRRRGGSTVWRSRKEIFDARHDGTDDARREKRRRRHGRHEKHDENDGSVLFDDGFNASQGREAGARAAEVIA